MCKAIIEIQYLQNWFCSEYCTLYNTESHTQSTSKKTKSTKLLPASNGTMSIGSLFYFNSTIQNFKSDISRLGSYFVVELNSILLKWLKNALTLFENSCYIQYIHVKNRLHHQVEAFGQSDDSQITRGSVPKPTVTIHQVSFPDYVLAQIKSCSLVWVTSSNSISALVPCAERSLRYRNQTD